MTKVITTKHANAHSKQWIIKCTAFSGQNLHSIFPHSFIFLVFSSNFLTSNYILKTDKFNFFK